MRPNALIRILSLGLVLALLTACAGAPGAAPVAEEPESSSDVTTERLLVLGEISDDPGEVIEGAQPLADYLAANLADFGYTGGQVRVVKSIEEMTELLKNGEVDIYFDSTYPATLISDASGAQIILRRWRFGVEEYRSVIFATKESGITSLDDLRGKIIAMDAPYSTSGYMLPAVYLTQNGLSLVGKETYTETVRPDEVGFVFSYDDENTLQWILSGLVQAGATDDYNFDVAFPPEVTEQLVELARTEYTPRQVVVVRPGMSAGLLAAIKDILVGMDEVEEAQAALENFQTTQFDEFPEGFQAASARMREMMELVQDIPLP